MKLKIAAMLAAGLLAIGNSFGGTLAISLAPNQSGNGGPFVVTTSDIGAFYTFCLEIPEPISTGVVYDYFSSDAAYAGGAGGGNPDTISRGSVWLMEKYGSSIGALSVPDAAAMQLAFWMLEDELAVDELNPYIAEVAAFFGSSATAKLDYVNLGNVLVLNPSLLESPRQSLIIITSRVADAGTSLMLLGLGLGSLGLISRRFRR